MRSGAMAVFAGLTMVGVCLALSGARVDAGAAGPEDVLTQTSTINALLDGAYDGDMRTATDSVLERRAYLEMCLGRALARCGDRRGYDILLRYLDDVRGAFARSAADELRELLGGPEDRDPAEWRKLVEKHAGPLPVKAFDRRIE